MWKHAVETIDVDSEGNKRPLVLQKNKEAAISDGGDSVCVCTFGTLGTRSAILASARGLGIDIDEAQYLTTMIPQERGFLWPLKDCIYGNKEKDREPIKMLINEFDKYPGFLDMCFEIEGLVCQRGIHACFSPDTKVIVENGSKEIKDIVIGDKVLTIDGSYQKVSKVMINESNELYEIKSKGLIEPLKATGNHPLLVLRDNKEKWIEVEKLLETDIRGIS